MELGVHVFIQSLMVTFLDVFILIRSHYVGVNEKVGKQFKMFAFATAAMQGLATLMIGYDYCVYRPVRLIQYIAYILILFCMTYCTYCWYEFMVNAILKKRLKGKIFVFLRVFPILAVVGLAISSIWTGLLFELSADGVFIAGPYFALQGLFSMAYVFAGVVIGIHVFNRTPIEEFKDALRLFCAYLIPCATAILIQAMGYKGGYTPIGMSVGMMIMYLDLYISDVKVNRELKRTQDLLNDAVCEQEEQLESIQELNAQLEEARVKAEAANASKSAFLASMSHEIRTPINAVLGMNTMILRKSKEAEILAYAKNLESAGNSLLSIINDILDFSKIESGKMELVEVDYDVASLLNDIYNMIELKAADKNLKFVMEIDEKVPCRLWGDDVRIRQILINLLTNAVKYTHTGTVTLKMAMNPDGTIHYAIKDTGIGIKKKDISKLTEQFVRIEESRNRNIEGTGLGINIVVNLLKLMDSRLQVASVYGIGSEFSFDLAQRVTSLEKLGDFNERMNQNLQSIELYVAPFKIPDCKLLVVDDNAINRMVLRGLITDLECEVDEADSGKRCLELVQNNKYDIIFLDHMMPEMDGIETLQHMKGFGDYLNAKTPVVIVTANAISGAKEQYLQEGFDEYLSKPILPKKLECLIDELIPEDKKQ